MTRYQEINIEGWWTINFICNYDGIGCVICNIKEDTDFIPEIEGDRKYIFRLKDSKDITKYKFRDSVGILNKNEIKKWEIIDADGTDFSEDLGNVYGKVSLDNRFIRLFSEKMLEERNKIDEDLKSLNSENIPNEENQIDEDLKSLNSENISINISDKDKQIEEKTTKNSEKYKIGKNENENGMICLFEKLEMINKPLEYLIVLKKETSKLKKKIIKKFTKLKNFNKFNLNILFEDELLEYNYIIKNLLMYNTLYVKLPKTNIWTPHREWEADYFDEQMNELISIFRSFNAKEINYSITKNTEEQSNNTGNIGTGGVGLKGAVNKDKKHDTSLSYSIKYNDPIDKNDIKEEICEALYHYDKLDSKTIFPIRNLNFFYFWKHPEWIQQLSHRTVGHCNEMDFSHEETINSNITKSIATTLNNLNISFDSNICSLMKYTIHFYITYF
jgi:hypothetical protein